MDKKVMPGKYNGIQRARELISLSKQRTLTAAEIEELKGAHTGYGGLYSWNNGQYFTPAVIADFMIDILKPQDNSKVLEFSCGNGTFISSLLNKNSSLKITGIEISHELSTICKLCYPKTCIIQGDATQYMTKFEGNFDYIVGNPPFGEKITGAEGFNVAKRKSEEYFLEMAVRCLKEGGEAILILPEGIFANNSYKDLRIWLLKECYYISTISLPSETFYYTGTSVKTSIMYIKKKYKSLEIKDYEIFMAICKQIGWDSRGRFTNVCDLEKIKKAFLSNKQNVFKVFEKPNKKTA